MSEPIVTAANLWDLKASPATLEKTADALRKLSNTSSSAQNMVSTAARQVDGEMSWEGKTAQAYMAHQTRLTSDVTELGKVTLAAAGALDSVASVLRSAQSLIDDQRRKVSHVRATTSGDSVTFHPTSDAEATCVRKAVAEATEIRQWAEENLALNLAFCNTHLRTLDTILNKWKPHTLKVMDLNGGQGWHNGFRDEKGTDSADIDDLGRLIKSNNPNVVTLQEMFRSDAYRLQRWLNDNTDSEWEIHYAAATHKFNWSDHRASPFGNVVLVRKGSGITSSEGLPEVTLEEPGNFSFFGFGAEGRSMVGARVHLK